MGPLSENTREAMQLTTGSVVKIRHSTVGPPAAAAAAAGAGAGAGTAEFSCARSSRAKPAAWVGSNAERIRCALDLDAPNSSSSPGAVMACPHTRI